MGAGEVKRGCGDNRRDARSPILMRGCAEDRGAPEFAREARWLRRRIKPYDQQEAEKTGREEQRRVYRRNQVFGLLLVAAAICAWWLLHTNPKWIFPPGWWRW